MSKSVKDEDYIPASELKFILGKILRDWFGYEDAVVGENVPLDNYEKTTENFLYMCALCFLEVERLEKSS